MLIKGIFKLPGQSKFLIVLPDDQLCSVRNTISRRIRPEDLSPVNTSLSHADYIAGTGAEEIEIKNAKALQIWIQTLGISKSPLQAARMDAYMTQKQLSELSGVSLRDIQCIEGFVSSPAQVSIRTILKLADCLKVDPQYLLLEM